MPTGFINISTVDKGERDSSDHDYSVLAILLINEHANSELDEGMEQGVEEKLQSLMGLVAKNHPSLNLEKVFGSVSKKMEDFLEKLKIKFGEECCLIAAREILARAMREHFKKTVLDNPNSEISKAYTEAFCKEASDVFDSYMKGEGTFDSRERYDDKSIRDELARIKSKSEMDLKRTGKTEIEMALKRTDEQTEGIKSRLQLAEINSRLSKLSELDVDGHVKRALEKINSDRRDVESKLKSIKIGEKKLQDIDDELLKNDPRGDQFNPKRKSDLERAKTKLEEIIKEMKRKIKKNELEETIKLLKSELKIRKKGLQYIDNALLKNGPQRSDLEKTKMQLKKIITGIELEIEKNELEETIVSKLEEKEEELKEIEAPQHGDLNAKPENWAESKKSWAEGKKKELKRVIEEMESDLEESGKLDSQEIEKLEEEKEKLETQKEGLLDQKKKSQETLKEEFLNWYKKNRLKDHDPGKKITKKELKVFGGLYGIDIEPRLKEGDKLVGNSNSEVIIKSDNGHLGAAIKGGKLYKEIFLMEKAIECYKENKDKIKSITDEGVKKLITKFKEACKFSKENKWSFLSKRFGKLSKKPRELKLRERGDSEQVAISNQASLLSQFSQGKERSSNNVKPMIMYYEDDKIFSEHMLKPRKYKQEIISNAKCVTENNIENLTVDTAVYTSMVLASYSNVLGRSSNDVMKAHYVYLATIKKIDSELFGDICERIGLNKTVREGIEFGKFEKDTSEIRSEIKKGVEQYMDREDMDKMAPKSPKHKF